ncbi:MAG: PIN domain-containing protein [Nitrososphaerales archaeon]|nr:PIN domain-containing protein [Nitrososphaerales archaeon]
MKAFVIDTGALTLFFVGDSRLATPFYQIASGRAAGFISSVNLAEFFYKTCQKAGRDAAGVMCRRAERRLQVVVPDAELALAAGAEKCRNGRLSLADSFVLALAKRVGGTVLTTDSEMAKCGEVRVTFYEL